MKVTGFILAVIISIVSVYSTSAQDKVSIDDFTFLNVKVIDGDSVGHMLLSEVKVFAPLKFKSERKQKRYTKLMRNVKKTLPYARIAQHRLRIINDSLVHITDEKTRKEYLKVAEKELFAEFEGKLRKLTFSQGRLLIRLIDRETGNTSYALIKEYKGGVNAFFWQGIARVFGSNLKSEFDADGDDKMIEYIIWMIDSGKI